MNNGQKSLSINETFIIEAENDGTMSACTGFFTNALVSCTGNTQILLGTNIIQANSAFSATTFYGDGSNLTGILNRDTFVTGGTFNSGVLTITNNTGGTFSVSGFSGTFSGTNNHIAKFTPNGQTLGDSNIVETNYGVVSVNHKNRTFLDGNTLLSVQRNQSQVDVILGNPDFNQPNSISSDNMEGGFDIKSKGDLKFFVGSAYTESLRFSNNGDTFIIKTPDNGFYEDSILLRDQLTGVLRQIPYSSVTFNGGIISATTYFINGLSANTFSATTYLGLPTDIKVTGGTYNSNTGIASFTNNTGGTFSVSGFNTGYTLTKSEIINTLGFLPLSSYTDTFVTGGTFQFLTNEAIFTNNTGGTFSVSGFSDIVNSVSLQKAYDNGNIILNNGDGLSSSYENYLGYFVDGGGHNSSERIYQIAGDVEYSSSKVIGGVTSSLNQSSIYDNNVFTRSTATVGTKILDHNTLTNIDISVSKIGDGNSTQRFILPEPDFIDGENIEVEYIPKKKNLSGVYELITNEELEDYVPYTGGTKNIILSGNGLTSNFIQFNTGITESIEVGKMLWNNQDGTFDIGLLNNVTLQNGQEIHLYGKASGAISNGDAVQFAGSQGNHLLVKKAVPSEITENPEYFIGIATQDFANNDFGYVTVFGQVRDLNTSMYSGGTILYFQSSGSTAGLLTPTRPTGPLAKVIVASVVRSHNTQGSIFVRPQIMQKLTTLQDVEITGLTNGQVLSYNSTTGVWIPRTISEYSAFTGGTVTGNTVFTNGVTANTISATTYYNLPPINLDNLSDVTILSGITSGDTLMYNGSVWENINPFDYFDAKPIIYQKHTNIPTFGSAAINNVEGVSIIASGPVARNWADTDIVTRTQRMGLAVSTTGNLAQLRQTLVYLSRNGGFDLTTGFNMAENASDTAIRFFIGVSTIVIFTNIEPNTLLNCIGVCRLSTSNNLHIVHNDNTGIGTTIDLGTNFPANTISTDKYLINIKTVSTGVYLKLDRIGTAFSYETTLTSDIPSTSTGLNYGAYIVDTTGASVTTGFDWYGSYIIS